MELRLPAVITGRKELLRLRRDAEELRDGLIEKRVAADKADVKRGLQGVPQSLQAFIDLNNIAIEENALLKLDEDLAEMFRVNSEIRIAFASEPDVESLQKVVSWFRDNIDHQILLQVGVQPAIAGGAIVHTGKNRYDMSLKTTLENNKVKFTQAVENAD